MNADPFDQAPRGNGAWMEPFFTYAHLPEKLQKVSAPVCDVARWAMRVLPDNPERAVALRKLLEAKDAAVRSLLMGDP